MGGVDEDLLHNKLIPKRLASSEGLEVLLGERCIDYLARVTEDYSGSDLQELCSQVGRDLVQGLGGKV